MAAVSYATKPAAHPRGVTHVTHTAVGFGYTDYSYTRNYLAMGIVSSLATTVLLAIGTGTGSWAWSNNGSYSNFHIGLWTACAYNPLDTACINSEYALSLARPARRYTHVGCMQSVPMRPS